MEINTLLEFQPDTVRNIRKNHGYQDEESIKESVLSLDNWVKGQSDLKNTNLSRQYLENIILASKGSIERAQKKLENLCRLRTQQPQFFGDFHIKNDFKEFQETMTYAILPKLTKDYNRILLVKCTGKNFQSNLILQFSRICIMIFEYLKVKDYSDGIVAVVDLTQVSLMEAIKRINLQDLRQATTILIEGYGVRVKGLHVISKSKVVNAFVWIFKQVLNAKLVSRIQVHYSIMTLKNFIPRYILPVEYGGTEKSFGTINQEWVTELSSEEFRNYLSEMNEAFISTSNANQTSLY